MQEVTAGYREVACNKGLTLKVEPSEGPMWVVGDSGALGEVFSNLIFNAISYTPQGAP